MDRRIPANGWPACILPTTEEEWNVMPGKSKRKVITVKKGPATRRAKVRETKESGSVTVRMFCQGLGDCFLITIPQNGSRPYSILIDCGVAMGTPSAEDIMKQAVKSIAELTKGTVDLIVVTHQHWDHVSGFVHAADEMRKQIKFKHLWLAWTENSNDKLAQELQSRFAKAKLALARAFNAAASLKRTDATSTERLEALSGVFAFFGPGASEGKKPGKDLDAAMALPRELVQAKDNPNALDYLLPGVCKELPGSSGLAGGVQAFVLGPPHDRSKLMRINPSTKPGEAYEKKKGDPPGFAINWAWMASAMSDMVTVPGIAGDPDDAANVDRSQPFDDKWSKPLNAAKSDEFFDNRYFSDAKENEGRRIDGDWLWSGAQRLALKMDNYTNNTCLVLAFELPKSKRVLLFAADAQVGNWLSWHDQDYETKDGRKLSATDLLANTTLYKVGHHGSHNATLKEKGLDLMTHPDLVAMLPVEADGVMRLRYGQMPLRSLMKTLGEKTEGRILRLDGKWRANTPPGTWTKGHIKARLSPEQITVGIKGQTSKRSLYMELVLQDK